MFKPSTELKEKFKAFELIVNSIAEEKNVKLSAKHDLEYRLKDVIKCYVEESFDSGSLVNDCKQFAELLKYGDNFIHFVE